MNQSFTLSPKQKTSIDPDRILVKNELNILIATIYADQQIAFTKNMLTVQQIDEIQAILKNFYLFYSNLKKVE